MGTDVRERQASRRPLLEWDTKALVAIVVVGGAVVVATRPSFVTGFFGSAVAVGVAVAVPLLLLGLWALLRRFVDRPAVRFVVMLVALGVVAWLLVVPAYRTTTVEEAFPTVAAAPAQPQPTVAAEPEADTAPAAPEATAPAAPAAAATAAPTPAATAAPAPAATQAPAPPEPPPPPPEPVRVTTGSLVGLARHDATGPVSVYRLGDGSHIVRFEDVAIEPGPDFVVYLVPGHNQESPADGAIALGPLTATNGTFNYTVPPDFDTAQPFTVLVWCRAFAVPIGAASQA